MNLKDYLKIFRRRILWFIGTAAVVFALFLGYFYFTQKPTYTAKARVQIETPAQPNFVSQLPQRTITTPTTQATWQSLITTKQVRENAAKRLKEKGFDPAWIGTVSTSAETGTSLVMVEGRGGSPAEAAEVANTVADAAAEYSTEQANAYINDIESRVDQYISEDKSNRGIVEAKIQELLQVAGAQPRADLDRLRADLDRLLALERKRRSLEYRLTDIQQKRAISEHLGADPFSGGHGELLIRGNPRVEAVAGELRTLHRELTVSLHKYTPQHETVLRLKDEILTKQEELAQARREAAGRDLDIEELGILNEIQLAEIEAKSIGSVAKIQSDYDEKAGQVRTYEALDKQKSDLDSRIAQYEINKNTLTTFKNQVGYVKVIEPAESSAAIGVPSGLQKYWPMGLLIAVVLGAAAAYFREMLDTALRTDYDVKRHLNLPVVTDIPEVGRNEILIQTAAEGSFMAEKFDTLATILQTGEIPPKTILVSSSVPKEGKTTISVNLAVAFARQGRRTLLIDGDMRVPSVHNIFQLPNSVGFSDLLLGTVAFDPADQSLLREAMPNLTVCTSGSRPENPYALLDQTRVQVVIEAAKQNYDMIVLDSPPILRTGDALKMAALADTTLLVIEAGRTDMREATWAKRLLENVSAKISGVLLNKAGGAREQYYYYYSYRPAQTRST